MILRTLSLTNFKNIAKANLEFSPKLNCLLGDNGMGKSNLLDAIYVLSFCKSFTGIPDNLLMTQGEDFAMLQANYQRVQPGREAAEDLLLGLQRGRRKILKRNGKEYRKLSEHIGRFPLVLISPADMELVNGTGEERRRLMDMVISQTDARYLDALIRYGQGLEQRNRMLRDGIADESLYQAIEVGMEAAAAYICRCRAAWTRALEKKFHEYYRAISDGAETPSLRYASQLGTGEILLSQLFAERRQRDAILKYTTAGPQRDDIEMLLSGLPVKRSASQGQAKSYTIAMRLAQYDFLKEATGITPLLLLDDIFDKLDANRVERIMKVVTDMSFGQIFITDTNRKHIDEILGHCGEDYAMWTVSHGEFKPLKRTIGHE